MKRIERANCENAIELNFCKAFELSTKGNGIGVALSNRIVNERNQNGDFKDWKDVQKRVCGVGLKTIQKLQNNGVNITKYNTYELNEPVIQKGFEIEYVDIGPETRFSFKKNYMSKDLCLHMSDKQNSNKRNYDQS